MCKLHQAKLSRYNPNGGNIFQDSIVALKTITQILKRFLPPGKKR